MNEDYMLDEDFKVDNTTRFIGSLSSDELDFLLSNKSNMSPCTNCGEWVNRKNLVGTICYLCSKSDNHTQIRGSSEISSNNHRTLEALVNRLEELRNDSF